MLTHSVFSSSSRVVHLFSAILIKIPDCFQCINKSLTWSVQCWNIETVLRTELFSPHQSFNRLMQYTTLGTPMGDLLFSWMLWEMERTTDQQRRTPGEWCSLFVKADTRSRMLCSSVKPDQPPGTVNYVQHSSSAKTCTEVIMLQDQRCCNAQQKWFHTKQRAGSKKNW